MDKAKAELAKLYASSMYKIEWFDKVTGKRCEVKLPFFNDLLAKKKEIEKDGTFVLFTRA